MTMHPAYRVRSGLDDWALEVLDKRVSAFLSTIRADGTAHTVPTGFAFDGERFLIPTGTGSGKVRNIERDPRVRVLVEAPTETMGQDGWVATDGTARIVGGEEAREHNRLAEGRYLTEAGMAVYDEVLAPMMDLTIVVTPGRWQTWVDSAYFQPLLDLGYSDEEVDGWFLPPHR